MPAVNPYELMLVKQQAAIALAHVAVAYGNCADFAMREHLHSMSVALKKIVDQPD